MTDTRRILDVLESKDLPLSRRDVLRLAGEQTLSLSGVDGDAPFGMAARRLPGEGPRGR